MNANDEYQLLETKQTQNKLLNVEADGESVIEVLAPNYKALFYALVEWKEIEIDTLFTSKPYVKDDVEYIDAGDLSLVCKDVYTKADLEQPIRNVSFGSKVDNKKMYLAASPSASKRVLDKCLEHDTYLSFNSLFYRDGDNNLLKSPLIFLRVKIVARGDKYYMVCLSDGPIFNEALVRFVRTTYGVDIAYNNYDFDLYNYISFVSHRVSSLLWGIEESCYIGLIDIMESNRETRVLNQRQETYSNQVLRSLQNGIEVKESGSIEEVIKDTLSVNGIVGVTCVEDCLKESLVKEIITNGLKVEKNILLVGDKKIVDQAISDLKIANLVSPYSVLHNEKTLYETFSGVNKENYSYEYDTDKYVELSNIQEQFYMMEEERESIDIPTGETMAEMVAKAISLREKSVSPLHITISSDYHEDDYLADKECIDLLEKSSSLKDVKLTDHPFYGLEIEETEMNFRNLKEKVRKICEDIDLFFAKAQELSDMSLGFVDIQKLRDYDEYVNHFELLASYTGFPTKYFEFDDDERLLSLLNATKNIYKVIGSLKLSIENITSPTFFDADWSEVLASAKNKDRAAKKKLKAELKKRNRKTYKSLLVLLENYYINRNLVESYLVELQTNYDVQVAGIDDAIGVEEALAYVDNFVRHAKLYDAINFDNDFTRKYFTDEDYRKTLCDVIWPALEQLRFNIETDFDEFKEFNPHDYNDYSDETYQELKDIFTKKLEGSYQAFSEYCNFSSKLKDASHHFKDFLNEYSDLEITMSSFGADYQLSLYEAIYANYKMIYGGSEAWVENEEKYIASLQQYSDLQLHHDLEPFFITLKQRCERDELTRVREELKTLFRKTRIFNANFMFPRYHSALVDYYPIDYVDSSELYAFPKVSYDIVVVLEGSDISFAQFINAVLLGKEVIVISKDKSYIDNPVKVSYSTILGEKVWDKCLKALESLFSNLDCGYDAIIDYALPNGDSLPLVLTRLGLKEPSFVLIPDLVYLLDNSYLASFCSWVPRVIQESLNVTPIIINTLEITLAKDKNIYIRRLLDGQLEQKRLTTPPEVVETEEDDEETNGSKRKYLRRLTDIYNSFSSYPTKSEIEELLAAKEYETLFEKIAPLNSTKLISYGQEFCQYVLERQKKGEVILRNDRFFLDPKKPIEVRKSLIEQRDIEDISVDEVVRAIYIYLSNFSFLKEPALTNELVHIFSAHPEDRIFVDLYEEAKKYLAEKAYIIVDGDKLKLNI